MGQDFNGGSNRQGCPGSGDLVIKAEAVLVAIPRGDEELRVTYTTARAGDRDVSWHSLRIFWKTDAGEWRPGKQGITIRAKELDAVTKALTVQVMVERDDTADWDK